MRVFSTVFFLVGITCLIVPTGDRLAAEEDLSDGTLVDVEQAFLESEDYYYFAKTYWARAASGDTYAMVMVHNALMWCDGMAEAIRRLPDAEAFAEKARKNPNLANKEFAQTMYHRCYNVAHHFDEFPGWESLRVQAALAGHSMAQVWTAIDMYVLESRGETDLNYEGLTPGPLLIQALASRDPSVYGHIGEAGSQYGLLEDPSEVNARAWQLLACRFGRDCKSRASLDVYCATNFPNCHTANSLEGMLRSEWGNDSYNAAWIRSAELKQLILEERWDELGLRIKW